MESRDWEEGVSSASDLWSSPLPGLGNIGQNSLGDHVVLEPKIKMGVRLRFLALVQSILFKFFVLSS